MTVYEFYLNENGVLCLKIDDTDFLLEGKFAINELEKLKYSQIKEFRITSQNASFITDTHHVTLIDYRKLMSARIDSLNTIFSKLKKAVAEKQRKKHQKIARNRVIAGTTILTTIGALALTALMTSAHEKEKDTLEQSSVIETESSIDFDSKISDGIVQSLAEKLPSSVPIPEIEIPSFEESQVAYLDFEDERYSITGEHTYNSYYDLVEPYAEMWGLPPNLMTGMLAQETAGNYTNLMQIEFDAWNNDKQEKPIPITVYNFAENKYQKFVLTDHPENYDSDIICITREDLENPKINISVACILLRQSLSYMDYHIGAGIQCYNYGYGNMQKVLNHTTEVTGISKQEILADQTNLDFMNYTDIIKNQGDSNYLMHVLRYVENIEEGLDIRYINSNGEIDILHVTILPSSKKM